MAIRKKILQKSFRMICCPPSTWQRRPMHIGSRIRALREEKGLTQEDVSRVLGFNDRQTLSAIENGERRVSAEELLLLVQRLAVPLDYFTDPFRLVGEGAFSWRQTSVGPERLAAYEQSAGRWIAAYRVLTKQIGRVSPLLRRSLSKQHSYEDAAAAGERFAAEFGLGEVPARGLADVIERELGILVLMVDVDTVGISGAACRLPELDVVLINRNEVAGRRHFDLAHELFHILTWDAMTPEHIEESTETSKSRVEQLANSFASGLLMPAKALDRFDPWGELEGQLLAGKLNACANELRVTASALKWRLVSLKRLTPAAARSVADAAIRNNGRKRAELNGNPALFSRTFMEVIAQAIKEGHISARRVSSLLDVPVDELDELFHTHHVSAPDEE